jgi:hypothetical protein
MVERDLKRRLEIIERGVHELEGATDPSLRAAAQQLVQAILELHAAGLERVLEIVRGSGIAGPPIVDQLGQDPLVSHLLVLHSLHPLTLESRVRMALESVRSALSARQAAVELISVVDGVVTLRLAGGRDDKAAIERAIFDRAPDVVALEIEGGSDAVVGFVPLGSVRRSTSGPSATESLAP